MHPDDCEDTCIKTGEGKTRKGLVKRKQQESLGWAALAHWEVREEGALVAGSGVSLRQAASCPLP